MKKSKLTLALRPATENDFKVKYPGGRVKYLFGKIYCVKSGPDRWSLNLFTSSKTSKLHFTECYKAGLVYVVDNCDELGLIDVVAPEVGQTEMEM